MVLMPDFTRGVEAVDSTEVRDAFDPGTGAGSPATAPHVPTDISDGDVVAVTAEEAGTVKVETKPGTASGKLKLVALLQVLGGATLTLLVVLFPDLLTTEQWTALGVWLQAVLGGVGAYLGKPGEVVPVDSEIAGV